MDGISDEEKVCEIVTEDQYFTFCFDDKYVTVFYQDDAIYEIRYFDGIVYYVEESMMLDEPVDNSSWQKEYKNIICKIEDNLVDPYSLRSGSKDS